MAYQIGAPSVSYGQPYGGFGSTVSTAAGPGGAKASAFTHNAAPLNTGYQAAPAYQQPVYPQANPYQIAYQQPASYNLGGYGGYQQPSYQMPQYSMPQYIQGAYNVGNYNLPPQQGINQVRVSRDVTNLYQPILNYFTDILEKQQNTYYQPINYLQQIIKQIPGVSQYLPTQDVQLPLQYQGYDSYGMGGYGQQQYGGYDISSLMGGIDYSSLLGGYGQIAAPVQQTGGSDIAALLAQLGIAA